MIRFEFRNAFTRKQRFALRPVLAGILVLLSSAASSQTVTDEDNYTRGSVFARLLQVDNATAVGGGIATGEQVDELQTRLGASLEAQRRSELVAASLGYEFVQAQFEEESQPDDSYWQGESRVNVGNASSFYEVDAFHSRRRVLNTPGASPILLRNSQDREIVGVSPLLRLRMGRANSLGVLYSFTEVDFGDTDSNDSSRQGFDLIYTRYVSSIRELRLRVGQREVDYDTSDFADYDTDTISVEMLAEHRRYDYQLSLGVSEVTPVQAPEASEKEVIGDFSLRYQMAGNIFSLFANRSISDSSRGSGNDSFFSTEISFDSSIIERDQIIRSSFGLGWIYELLCGRCTLALNLGMEESDYINLSRNDSEQRFVDLSVNYDFSSQLRGTLGYRSTNTDLTNDAAILDDTDSQVVRVALDYQVNRSFNLAFSHERDERTRGAGDEFVVNSTGLTATLSFE